MLTLTVQSVKYSLMTEFSAMASASSAEGFSFTAEALPEEESLRAMDAAGLAALPMPTAMRAFREAAGERLKAPDK